MSTKFSIGQMNQLADALETAGFTLADVTKLRSPEMLSKFKLVLGKRAEFVAKKYIVNCDADPFVPEGWEVVEHRKGGEFDWNPDKVELYLCDGQRRLIQGNKLHKKLEGKPVLNANELDYLLVHPELIPKNWKSKRVFFWGTIYRDSRGLCVRFLSWDDGLWRWNARWLDGDWFVRDPAALSVAGK